MKSDRTTLIILIMFMLLIIPARVSFSRQIEEKKLEVAEQKCIELVEVMAKKGIEGFRWNDKTCGKCYPEQARQRRCEL